ncbi:hypothetical protein LTR62_006267 [Meristemomyces frigidus]|uniref:Uncharacterized protein n=1 Tax=Meristemomyces frigidus TaxID=1508187 RepID=A0AAN7TBZ3_9PEZI|nr:hypothetical protein LTR62_006267 [Meristemomyces frigidus]
MGLLTAVTITTAATVVVAVGLLTGTGLGILLPAFTAAGRSDETAEEDAVNVVPLQEFFSTIGQAFETYTQNAIALAHAVNEMDFPPDQQKSSLVLSYSSALESVWIMLCIFSAVALLISLVLAKNIRWRPRSSSSTRGRTPDAYVHEWDGSTGKA